VLDSVVMVLEGALLNRLNRRYFGELIPTFHIFLQMPRESLQ
jgi:hypothetical protein